MTNKHVTHSEARRMQYSGHCQEITRVSDDEFRTRLRAKNFVNTPSEIQDWKELFTDRL